MLRRTRPTEPRSVLSEWDRLFDEMFGWWPSRMDSDGSLEWAPRVDVREEKDRYTVDFELPGLEKENIQVTMENGVLNVTGERQHEADSKDEQTVRRERSYGKFSRCLRFPDDVDSEKIEAGFKNGVLRVAIPKKEEAKPRTIEIK
jgi:HSP20 family protein